MGLLIRPAEPRDEARIREVAAASKGHWGYDPARVRSWAATLELVGEVEVAENGGQVVAWSALLPGEGDACVLEELWVDPPCLRGWCGLGPCRRRHEYGQCDRCKLLHGSRTLYRFSR